MSDDARHPLTDEERARIHTARRNGRLCAGCGRALADGEPVWWAPFILRGLYGRLSRRRAPVGRECAPTALLRETEADGPEACLGCGRGVHYGSASRPRDRALCSERCRDRHDLTRARKEPRG